MNRCDKPAMIWLLVGVTTSEVRVALDAVTASDAEPVMLPFCAIMRVVPELAPVASPPEVIEAVAGEELDQVEEPVMLPVVPSL